MTTAQPIELSALELCASQETPELKLACFEAIIADNKATDAEASGAAESAAATQPSVQAETVASAAAVSAAVASAVAPTADTNEEVAPVAESAATAPSVQAEVEASAAPASPVVAEAVAPEVGPSKSVTPAAESVSAAPVQAESEELVAVAAVSSADDEFGQEYLEKTDEQKEKENDEDLRATVVDVSKGRHDILYFHLDNGQVWRQNEARHYSYPKNNEFDVTISRGMMGDYRMRIGDNGRMVRVRRIK